MPREEISVDIDQIVLKVVDTLVKDNVFQNRSQVINAVLKEKLSNTHQDARLKSECQKLIMEEERDFADMSLKEDFKEWERY